MPTGLQALYQLKSCCMIDRKNENFTQQMKIFQ